MGSASVLLPSQKAITAALKEGIENVTLGPVAEDVVRRYREDPFVLERELIQLPMGSTAI